MTDLQLRVAKWFTPRVVWFILVVAMLALALAAGAPEGGSCGGGVC